MPLDERLLSPSNRGLVKVFRLRRLEGDTWSDPLTWKIDTSPDVVDTFVSDELDGPTVAERWGAGTYQAELYDLAAGGSKMPRGRSPKFEVNAGGELTPTGRVGTKGPVRPVTLPGAAAQPPPQEPAQIAAQEPAPQAEDHLALRALLRRMNGEEAFVFWHAVKGEMAAQSRLELERTTSVFDQLRELELSTVRRIIGAHEEASRARVELEGRALEQRLASREQQARSRAEVDELRDELAEVRDELAEARRELATAAATPSAVVPAGINPAVVQAVIGMLPKLLEMPWVQDALKAAGPSIGKIVEGVVASQMSSGGTNGALAAGRPSS